MQKLRKSLCLIVAMVLSTSLLANDKAVLNAAPNLFDMLQTETLGLQAAPGLKTYTVFAPKAGENHYNHGAVLTYFKGRYYVQWQSSKRDEDSEDTAVYYASSHDLSNWSKPRLLSAASDKGIATSGGWWTHGNTLIAYINIWPDYQTKPRTGHVLYVHSADGINWSAPQPVLDHNNQPLEGVIEQDLRPISGGRIVGAFHVKPGLTAAPFYTDDPSGVEGWTRGIMPNMERDGDTSRGIEPSLYERPDGSLVMIFRDQQSSFKTLASESFDKGETWNSVTLADFPDSRSKQSAGTLPNGMIFRVNNPTGNKRRSPLVLTLSANGKLFDQAYLLRSGGHNLQPMRQEGRYKRSGYSYPKSVVIGDHLYVAYATNKEDIEISQVPISTLKTIF